MIYISQHPNRSRSSNVSLHMVVETEDPHEKEDLVEIERKAL